MTDTVFNQCFAIVVGEEGGLTNDAADPGGLTNWGISQAAYPSVNIRALTKDGAEAIYLRDYWTPAGCDKLPGPLALMVFDAAVNNGLERAKDWLQMAVGVKADGEIGPETLGALTKALAAPLGAQTVATEFLARRIDLMGGLKTWGVFGLGWSRRLASLPYLSMGITG